MMHKVLLSILIIICFTVTCFCADDTWDLTEKDPEELYNDGLISDDAYDALKSDEYEEYGYLIPVEGISVIGSGKLDDSTSSLSLEESQTGLEVGDLSGQTSILMASVPTSGGAYTDPILIGVEYAPDPPDGSFMSVLYDLIGKPVSAYHYRYTSSSQNVTQYSCDIVDYDLNWIISAAFLGLIVLSIFKAGGALICKM